MQVPLEELLDDLEALGLDESHGGGGGAARRESSGGGGDEEMVDA